MRTAVDCPLVLATCKRYCCRVVLVLRVSNRVRSFVILPDGFCMCTFRFAFTVPPTERCRRLFPLAAFTADDAIAA